MYKIAFCMISIISMCYAQTSSFFEQKLIFEKFKMPEQDNEITTENGIDPNTYIIGQGDQFTAYAINSPTIVFAGQVTLESDVFIPEIGLIKVGPTTLKNAKEVINKKLIEALKGKNVEFYISLTKVKSATFTIGGCVMKPGTYIMKGNHRISDAIKKANEDSSTLKIPDVNLREVLLICNGDTITLDMFEYLFKNYLKSNPYVYPGQNIYIPYATSRIKINGPIKNGLLGFIPIRKNESLRKLLDLCIFDESADTNTILIKKAKTGEIIETNSTCSDSIFCEDFDQITILKKPFYPMIQSIIVKGEVSRPGDYSINKKTTTLKMVITMAGGLTEYADFERMCIIRKKSNPTENLSDLVNSAVHLSINPEIQTSIIKMSHFKDYSVLRIKELSDSVLLIEGDVVYIPKKEQHVYVSGSVCRPGVVGFSKGISVDECIKSTGGYIKNADKDKVYVVSVYPENIILLKDKKNIESGDIIVVPEKQKYKVFSTVFIPILSAVLTSISIVWSIYNK